MSNIQSNPRREGILEEGETVRRNSCTRQRCRTLDFAVLVTESGKDFKQGYVMF